MSENDFKILVATKNVRKFLLGEVKKCQKIDQKVENVKKVSLNFSEFQNSDFFLTFWKFKLWKLKLWEFSDMHQFSDIFNSRNKNLE